MELSYPIEMYYADYDFQLPTISDQFLIVNEYKKYLDSCVKQRKKLDDNHITVRSMSFLLERKKQVSYFETVRAMVNFLVTQQKTAEELFISMFPDRESLVATFQQQYLDACEIFLNRADVDWERLKISWEKYNIQPIVQKPFDVAKSPYKMMELDLDL